MFNSEKKTILTIKDGFGQSVAEARTGLTSENEIKNVQFRALESRLKNPVPQKPPAGNRKETYLEISIGLWSESGRGNGAPRGLQLLIVELAEREEMEFLKLAGRKVL